MPAPSITATFEELIIEFARLTVVPAPTLTQVDVPEDKTQLNKVLTPDVAVVRHGALTGNLKLQFVAVMDDEVKDIGIASSQFKKSIADAPNVQGVAKSPSLRSSHKLKLKPPIVVNANIKLVV